MIRRHHPRPRRVTNRKPAKPRDPAQPGQSPERDVAKGDDHPWSRFRDFFFKKGVASRNGFVFPRGPGEVIFRWPTADSIRHAEVGPIEANSAKETIKHPTRGANEWLSIFRFLFTGGFSNDEDWSRERPIPADKALAHETKGTPVAWIVRFSCRYAA